MVEITLSRFILISAVAIGLSACGAVSAPLESSTDTHFDAAGSWISPAATKADLLYVSDARGVVDVFTYPAGEAVGVLKGFNSPAGLCSDASGNVYVVNTGTFEVLEYKHGAAKPSQTFYVMGYYPFGCSIDASSGDLAVADYSAQNGGPGGVSIFHPGQTFPSTYQDPNFNAYFFCSYDNAGNLYVDGADYGSYHTLFAELANGATSFTDISLDKTIGYPGGVQWDGTDVALQDTSSQILYRFKVRGTKGKSIGSASFKGDRTTLLHQFALAGNGVAMPYGPTGRFVRKLGIWPYPAGGAATLSIAVAHSTELVGVALSVARK